MTNFKSLVGQYRDKQTERIKHLNDAIEARKSRVANFGLRKEILQSQTMRNYNNEYNRIRAHLDDSAIPHETRQHLKSRTQHLKSLGASAVFNIA